MGLVIVPLMLMWFWATGLSLRIGYVLADVSGFFPYVLLCLLAAISGGWLYSRLVMARRKFEKELWAFQLMIDFTLNKFALSGYTILAGIYLFTDLTVTDDNLLSLIFIGTLVLSSGTLLGVFTSNAFMDRHKIERAY
ncbi:hypothetical protein [Oceanospirillum sp.]|uniref:hypothetical protein n=1 Tax=Oceanospirillum sp. TaxID=2021254 RepID=UPI003A94F6C3